MRIIAAIILLVSVSICKAAAFGFAADSLSEASGAISKPSATVEEADSTEVYNPLHRHGSICLLCERDYQSINKNDLLEINYTGAPEILMEETDAFPLHQGVFGGFNQLAFKGAAPINVVSHFNNRNIGDAGFGLFNLEQVPPEFIENIEITTGSDAAIFGGAAGALINFQQIRYDCAKPYTRMWFAEAAYNFLASDGIFSQNFAPNWNIALGFRGMSAAGKFENTKLESWNVRASIRRNLGDLTSVSLTENFVNHRVGLNGGIDEAATLEINPDPNSVYDEIDAVPNYSVFSDKVFRHDLTLSLSSIFDEDSTTALSATAYFSHSEWTLRRSEAILTEHSNTNTTIISTNRSAGLTAKLEQNVGPIKIIAGGELEHNFVQSTPYCSGYEGPSIAFFGRGRLDVADILALSGGARLQTAFGREALFVGAKLIFSPSSDFEAKIDLSRSSRIPSLVEGVELNLENHNLALFEAKAKVLGASVSMNLFARFVDNPILAEAVINEEGKAIDAVFHNGGSREVFGASLRAGGELISSLYAEIAAQSAISRTDGAEDGRFPAIFGALKVFYRIEISDSRLDIGVASKAASSYNGERFLPQTRAYIPYDEESGFFYSGIDAFALAKLGNARVRITYQNILSQNYYYVPLNPMFEGNIRMTVSWAFFD